MAEYLNANSQTNSVSIYDSGCDSDPNATNLDGTPAAAGDGTVAPCETDATIASMFVPDIQVFDANARWNPTAGGATPDAVSIGIAFGAVTASF